MLQAQKRAYFVAQEALRREDELKRISKINEEEDEEGDWGEEDGLIDNVSADFNCYQLFCAALIGKTRQDKMICNEKMKVAPPPRLIWTGVQLPVACLCHCILSPPLHLTNIRASSFLLDQSDLSQNLCGKGVHNLLTLISEDFFFNQTEIENSLRLEL